MFIPTALAEQARQAHNDSLSILIVGAGVAGLTLAQLLRQRGMHPVLVEREANHDNEGYMLGLVPLVEPSLRDLGVMDAYRQHSEDFRRYILHGRHGQHLHDYAIGALFARYGEYRGLVRSELMQVLADSGAPVSYHTTLGALHQSADKAHALLHERGRDLEAEFDLVVLADGQGSQSRRLLLAENEVSHFDTHWGGWVTWMPTDRDNADRCDEVWGKGFFVGLYPVKDKTGIFIGGHAHDTRMGLPAFLARVRRRLSTDSRIHAALDALEQQRSPYYWKLADCRSRRWAVNRTVLLGDAAAAFLPTAGIGASMAMESARRLAHYIDDASPDSVPATLGTFETAQRPRVEAAQKNSRQLAKVMFRRNALVTAIRDLATRFISMETALKPILELVKSMPD